MNQLEGKTAIVTGGARGLGAAISRMLVEEGATVLCGDVRADELAALAETMPDGPGTFMPTHLDVLDQTSVEAICAQASNGCGPLEILINNAAVDYCEPVDELTLEKWDHELGVNLRGCFVMAKQAYGLMKERGHGSIVNICSTASKRTWPNASAYHASKWGLLGFSHALHTEAREHGVKVTAIVTGGMRTPFLLDRWPDIDQSTLQDASNVANAVRFALSQPEDSVIPELTVIPMRETSWP